MSAIVSDFLLFLAQVKGVLLDPGMILSTLTPHPLTQTRPRPNMSLPEHSALLDLDKVMEKLILL